MATRPVTRGGKLRLSILIPCYNEADHIVRVLEAVEAVDIPKEIVVVNDGSSDNTAEVLEECSRDHSIVVHSLPVNSGKGAAIRAGLQLVTGDIVIIQDADLEYDPQQIPGVIKPIVEGEADVVYGSRFRGSIGGMRLANRIANRVLTLTVNMLYRAHITDEATCYKAFRTDVIKGIPLNCMKFEFCPEVTAKLLKRGFAIHEVPIRYVGRTTSQGKKIRWTDAFSAIWTLLKYRFRD